MDPVGCVFWLAVYFFYFPYWTSPSYCTTYIYSVGPLPGSGDGMTCNSQKDKLLKSTRAVRPDGCSGAHSAQDDEHPTAVLAHPFSSTESSAFTRQRQKHAKSPPRKRLDQC